MDEIQALNVPTYVMAFVADPELLKRAAFTLCRASDDAQTAARKTIDKLLEYVSILSPSHLRERIVETIEELALTYGTHAITRGEKVIGVCATDGSIPGFHALVKKLRNRALTTDELATIVTRYCTSPGQHPDKTERILREHINRLSERNAEGKARALELRAQISLALNGPQLKMTA